MAESTYKRIASLKTADEFRAYVAGLGIDLACDDTILTGADSPLAQPFEVYGRQVGNRWAVQPMEGWDGTTTGGVTEPMLRRWRRFGESGAKLIWGGEAMAIRPAARANPNQLIISEENEFGLARLRRTLLDAHRERYGSTGDLLLGFQLTHSGRFCRPVAGALQPRVAYRHPLLDARFGVTGDEQVLRDDEIPQLVSDYARAAKIARRVGADFVDVKHCHGYLLHEFLGAHTRPGPYGGSFENRTRLLCEIVAAIRAEVPGLLIAVRVSAFDLVPFKPDPPARSSNPERSGGAAEGPARSSNPERSGGAAEGPARSGAEGPSRAEPGRLGPGVPEDYSAHLPYRYGFGVDAANPVQPDLTEALRFLALLERLDIRLVNITGGSPYYNPHIQRPALFPPSDGYQPPEDPLVGVARQINAVKALKAHYPRLVIVGSAYSYLQEYLPQVAQHYLRAGHVDAVGLGRAVLSYPHMLADATIKGKLDRRLICRTFSDCTTAPRKGLPSGCYPLDEYYKASEDAARLKDLKGN